MRGYCIAVQVVMSLAWLRHVPAFQVGRRIRASTLPPSQRYSVALRPARMMQLMMSTKAKTDFSLKSIDWLQDNVVEVLNELYDPADVARGNVFAKLNKPKKKKKKKKKKKDKSPSKGDASEDDTETTDKAPASSEKQQQDSEKVNVETSPEEKERKSKKRKRKKRKSTEEESPTSKRRTDEEEDKHGANKNKATTADEEKDIVVTITTREQQHAKMSRKKAKKDKPSLPNDNDDAISPTKRVKFGNVNRARSYKASMKALRTANPKTPAASPEQSILRRKQRNKQKTAAPNKRKKAADYF
mmetsp:Transcript_15013/g.34185  ORF Transcript_15013/g.34185 Transcript_15013/m.34185 type:complete len:301 (-) Transcript_15013:81-983(-)